MALNNQDSENITFSQNLPKIYLSLLTDMWLPVYMLYVNT